MTDIQSLAQAVQQHFAEKISSVSTANEELTIELPATCLYEVCLALRDAAPFQFSQLIDICGVDYSQYGISQWETEATTATGFSRAVDTAGEKVVAWQKDRFAAVYHLLSLVHNQRIRVRVFLPEEALQVDSVTDIWAAANWYEREAFDLFGIIFKGHPDLRRILTDYGFIGHPFRKDFPLIGQVEMRYDCEKKRCIYEPVTIQPRTLVPKVIRFDNRYVADGPQEAPQNG